MYSVTDRSTKYCLIIDETRQIKPDILLQWLSLMYKFIQGCLNSDSVQVQILLATYYKFAIMKTSRLKTTLNAFSFVYRSTKQFIFVIFLINNVFSLLGDIYKNRTKLAKYLQSLISDYECKL